MLRIVIDVVKHCNLRCSYCHPGEIWTRGSLAIDHVAETLEAAEAEGVLEVVFSGGEPTLHPRLAALAEVIARSQTPSTVIVTNATRLAGPKLEAVLAANLRRVCVSLDGASDDVHGSARGDNFETVLRNLRGLRAAHDNITIISVAHRGNVRHLPQLSQFIREEGLANQHHICAPSYSGLARDNYADLRLSVEDYFWLQDRITADWHSNFAHGVFVTFNSFWPATGLSATAPPGRRVTLQQIVEQVKGTLVHVRSDGELRLASMSWGRETVGRSALGHVGPDRAHDLLRSANAANAAGDVLQLPRALEARHKFQLQEATGVYETRRLIDSQDEPEELTDLVARAIPLSRSHLLDQPLGEHDHALLRRARSGGDRDIVLSDGAGLLIYDRRLSHALPLKENECVLVA